MCVLGYVLSHVSQCVSPARYTQIRRVFDIIYPVLKQLDVFDGFSYDFVSRVIEKLVVTRILWRCSSDSQPFSATLLTLLNKTRRICVLSTFEVEECFSDIVAGV